MNYSEALLAPLFALLPQAPFLLLWLAGILLALRRWSKHPRVSLAATIAFAMLLLNAWLGTFLSAWLPGFLLQRGLRNAQIMVALQARSIIAVIILMLPWGLLLARAH